MITKAQAIAAHYRAELHAEGCKRTTGPRGGVTTKITTWRVTGACKTWKTRPEEFSLPVKYGFYGPCGYVDQGNAPEFHLASECPLDQKAETPA